MTRIAQTGISAAIAMSAFVLLVGCVPTEGSGPSSPGPTSPGPSARPTASESLGPTPVNPVPLTLFYVALGDAGTSGEPIGCGDSLVSVTTEPVTTDDILRASMERLLADTDRELGESGLCSALPGGTLRYLGGAEADGVVTVDLTGQPAPAGTCDNPRIEEQLERTAMAATGAREARILVDGELIADVLSLR